VADPGILRLRALLKDAGALARDLGDEARPEPRGVGYFADAGPSGIANAISEIAAHTGEITMFVGAGVSMEAELPSWNALVRKLLIGTRRAGDEDDAVAAWADTVLEEGPLAAAAVAEALFPDVASFRRALRDAVYERDPDSYVPGALAGQIAWLKERLGSRLALLTVNYDGLLEAALAERGIEPVSYVRAWSEPSGKAAVWHLHGRLIRAASGKSWQREGNLVLSEGSYVRRCAYSSVSA
jgi:NAD-dependent SIR2 family protein deacetylase